MKLKEKAEQLEKEIKELEKGCGKDLKRKSFDGNIKLYCGIEVFISEKIGLKNVLCPECQSTLTEKQKHLATINSVLGGIEKFKKETFGDKKQIITEHDLQNGEIEFSYNGELYPVERLEEGFEELKNMGMK